MVLKNNIPHQHEGEKVITHLRRHWFVFFRSFLMFALLAFVPLIVYQLANQTFWPFLTGEAGQAGVLVLVFTYYLFLLSLILTFWAETYLDVWTVTNQRIINREQNGLFHRVVSELDLLKIQDITTEQKGVFATIFHYGNVYIQTAAEKERFVFEQVPRPYQVAKTIQKLNEELKKNLGRPV